VSGGRCRSRSTGRQQRRSRLPIAKPIDASKSVRGPGRSTWAAVQQPHCTTPTLCDRLKPLSCATDPHRPLCPSMVRRRSRSLPLLVAMLPAGRRGRHACGIFAGPPHDLGVGRVASEQISVGEQPRAVIVCKTVGLAYVGSNPTPATTCGNGPWPAHIRARGPSWRCPAVSHDVPL
jgi:hypothetical protein